MLAETAAAVGAEAIPGDLADPDTVDRVVAEIVAGGGGVDVLIAAAGGNVLLQGERPPGTAGVAWHWTENFRINTLTAVLLVEALKDHLNDGARVILVSSIAAFRGSGEGSYGGAKAALHPYSFDLANALGPRGITVNVVAPGYVAGTEFFRGGMTDQRHQALVDQTLVKRAGTAEDVADTVHWLASPRAGHVTAQVIQVNGGAR